MNVKSVGYVLICTGLFEAVGIQQGVIPDDQRKHTVPASMISPLTATGGSVSSVALPVNSILGNSYEVALLPLPKTSASSRS
ncbi:hypothetical protein MTBLM1_50207 [Rhodospirillaceae bacterium LM-1]|nr:hypothetical protein MTBLM1_50207 [Rhodospirillaceae bacterium LM-1]